MHCILQILKQCKGKQLITYIVQVSYMGPEQNVLSMWICQTLPNQLRISVFSLKDEAWYLWSESVSMQSALILIIFHTHTIVQSSRFEYSFNSYLEIRDGTFDIFQAGSCNHQPSWSLITWCNINTHQLQYHLSARQYNFIVIVQSVMLIYHILLIVSSFSAFLVYSHWNYMIALTEWCGPFSTWMGHYTGLHHFYYWDPSRPTC